MIFPLKAARWAFSASAIALVAGLAACAPQTTTNTPPSENTNASPAASSAAGGTVSISGAGSTAANPIYQRWFQEYNKTNQNIQISYDSVGSGAGVKTLFGSNG